MENESLCVGVIILHRLVQMMIIITIIILPDIALIADGRTAGRCTFMIDYIDCKHGEVVLSVHYCFIITRFQFITIYVPARIYILV